MNMVTCLNKACSSEASITAVNIFSSKLGCEPLQNLIRREIFHVPYADGSDHLLCLRQEFVNFLLRSELLLCPA